MFCNLNIKLYIWKMLIKLYEQNKRKYIKWVKLSQRISFLKIDYLSEKNEIIICA